MNEEQTALLDLIETLLSYASDDPTYRHIRAVVNTYEVFIEDTCVTVVLTTKRHGTIIDMERNHYRGDQIMEMLAGI